MSFAKDIDEQASYWVARTECDGAQADEAFLRWLNEDERHPAAFAQAQAVWMSAEQRFREIAERMPEPAATRRTTRWVGAAAAALALILLTSGMHAYWLPRSATVYVTERGEMEPVSLADGTEVWLNTASEIRVPRWSSTRTVELLRGEASFDVAHDPSRQFIVRTSETAVYAIGTQFNVRRYGASDVSVIVTEGKIAMGNAHGKSVTVGQVAEVTGAQTEVRDLKPGELDSKLSWRTGKLVFAGVAISEVADEIVRYNDLNIFIHDPSVAKRKFTGTFDAKKPQEFFDELKAYGIRTERAANAHGGGAVITLVSADRSADTNAEKR